jgi:hypothetical protein
LDGAGNLMKNPSVVNGMFSLGRGFLQSYEQNQVMQQQMKWAEAHAPGHVTGGINNPFGGFQMNQNLQQEQPATAAYNKTAMAGGPNPANLAAVPQIPGAGPYHAGLLNFSGGGGYPGGGGSGGGPGAQGWYPTQQSPDMGLLSNGPSFMENPEEEQQGQSMYG